MTTQVERRNKPEIILKLNSLLLAYFTSVGFGFQIPAHFLPPELNGLLYRNCVKAINEPLSPAIAIHIFLAQTPLNLKIKMTSWP